MVVEDPIRIVNLWESAMQEVLKTYPQEDLAAGESADKPAENVFESLRNCSLHSF